MSYNSEFQPITAKVTNDIHDYLISFAKSNNVSLAQVSGAILTQFALSNYNSNDIYVFEYLKDYLPSDKRGSK